MTTSCPQSQNIACHRSGLNISLILANNQFVCLFPLTTHRRKIHHPSQTNDITHPAITHLGQGYKINTTEAERSENSKLNPVCLNVATAASLRPTPSRFKNATRTANPATKGAIRLVNPPNAQIYEIFRRFSFTEEFTIHSLNAPACTNIPIDVDNITTNSAVHFSAIILQGSVPCRTTNQTNPQNTSTYITFTNCSDHFFSIIAVISQNSTEKLLNI